MKKRSPQLSLRLDSAVADPLAPWLDGKWLPFLGAGLALRLSTGREAAVREGSNLHITLPPQPTARQIRDCAEAWLRDEARRLIESAVSRHTERLGCPPPRWILSFAARANWAQADTTGTLRFHWRLIEQPAEVIDQVVSHAIAAWAPTEAHSDLFAGLTA
jgi:predicted metal-dependent hydrolase